MEYNWKWNIYLNHYSSSPLGWDLNELGDEYFELGGSLLWPVATVFVGMKATDYSSLLELAVM